MIPEIKLISLLVVVTLINIIVCFGSNLINLKLYTEIMKEKSQRERKDPMEPIYVPRAYKSPEDTTDDEK